MKKHIMLIENDRKGYTDLMDALQLMQLDCKVTYTVDYEHALQMLPYLVPDCVFMHIDVGGAKAFDCIRKIREYTVLSGVKVIAYDDQISTKMIRDAIKQGADYCIDTPNRIADINGLLKDLFNSNRSSS